MIEEAYVLKTTAELLADIQAGVAKLAGKLDAIRGSAPAPADAQQVKPTKQ